MKKIKPRYKIVFYKEGVICFIPLILGIKGFYHHSLTEWFFLHPNGLCLHDDFETPLMQFESAHSSALKWKMPKENIKRTLI